MPRKQFSCLPLIDYPHFSNMYNAHLGKLFQVFLWVQNCFGPPQNFVSRTKFEHGPFLIIWAIQNIFWTYRRAGQQLQISKNITRHALTEQAEMSEPKFCYLTVLTVLIRIRAFWLRAAAAASTSEIAVIIRASSVSSSSEVSPVI